MENPIPEIKAPNGITIRYTVPQDAEFVKKWLSSPDVKNAFPMINEEEYDDATRRWISFSRIRSSLTVEKDGTPVGIATLYIQIYKRLLHQSEFGIIVDKDFRGQGIGAFLLSSLLKLAKHQFHVSLIHLQVYKGNPAVNLYKKFGFQEFGRQLQGIKDDDSYVARIYMEREI